MPLVPRQIEPLRSQQFAVFKEKANIPSVITQRQMPLIRKSRLLRSHVQFFDDVVDPPAVSPDSCSRFGGPRDHEDLSGTVH